MADSGIVGEIDPDTGCALAVQFLPAHGGQQEGLLAHLQPGLQFLLCSAVRGLADQTAHGNGEGEVHGPQREQSVAVEAHRVGVRVEAAVVVVAVDAHAIST